MLIEDVYVSKEGQPVVKVRAGQGVKATHAYIYHTDLKAWYAQ